MHWNCSRILILKSLPPRNAAGSCSHVLNVTVINRLLHYRWPDIWNPREFLSISCKAFDVDTFVGQMFCGQSKCFALKLNHRQDTSIRNCPTHEKKEWSQENYFDLGWYRWLKTNITAMITIIPTSRLLANSLGRRVIMLVPDVGKELESRRQLSHTQTLDHNTTRL